MEKKQDTNIAALEATNMAKISDEKGVGSEEFRLEGLPKTTCSGCQNNKVRLARKTPRKSTRKYYEDEQGNPWNGMRCPSCVKLKAREHMKIKRSIKKEMGDV